MSAGRAVYYGPDDEYYGVSSLEDLVSETPVHTLSVIGEVARTGRIPMRRDLRVLDAIVTSGGFTQFADKGDVRIVRRQPDGGEASYRFDYNAYVKGKAPESNIVLQDGDTIIVSE